MKHTDSRKNISKENNPISVIMYLFLFLFLGMMAYFVYFQVVLSENFINNPYNSLQDLFAEHVYRGQIITSDGVVIAETSKGTDGSQKREYPYGRMFSHVVGFDTNGKMGIEKQANFSLLRSHSFFAEQFLNDLKSQKNIGDNVITTLDFEIQKRAYEALGEQEGAVIALEPSTGKVIAMVSKPDFDPNKIVTDWDKINGEGSSVLVNRATQGKYAPGSVFKMITALEYYRENKNTYQNYSFDCTGAFTEDGKTIRCAGNKKHGEEDLVASFANSCNSSFANLSLGLNRKRFQSTCEELLFNMDLPIAFESGKSTIDLSSKEEQSFLMETAIGQGDTLVSPLHMALIACAVDNQGLLMSPYLISRVENAEGVILSTNDKKAYKSIMTEDEAEFLKHCMNEVVESGTAKALKEQSYKAYGKTGTAQVSDSTGQTNGWFVGFCEKEGYEDLVVAVIVEGASSGSSEAVPVAKRIFDLYFNR